MKQVLKFLFVLPLRIRLRGPHDAHAGRFENACDVVGRRFPARTETRDELSANLFDFRRREARHGEFTRDFEDRLLLCRVLVVRHRNLVSAAVQDRAGTMLTATVRAASWSP